MNRRRFFEQFTSEALKAVGETAAEAFPARPGIPQKPRHGEKFRRVAVAGAPSQYEPGTVVLVEADRAWLRRDRVGFYAIDALCPHLGCQTVPDGLGFRCPCHGSQFTSGGAIRKGPAKRFLRFLAVSLGEDGNLVIHRDRTVSSKERFIA
jgi:Rieske Fe-S protein